MNSCLKIFIALLAPLATVSMAYGYGKEYVRTATA